MNRKLLLIGGGGHCKSVLDSLYQSNDFAEIGIIDKQENVGGLILDTPIIGSDDDLPSLFKQGYNEAFITVGSVGNSSNRLELTELIKSIGFKNPNVIDPSATISRYCNFDQGIYVGKRAVINAGSTIGNGAIINTSVTVEHDCEIGDFVHLASGSVLCGEVTVREQTHIGANSVVKQVVVIGSGVMIGMGSVVLQNIPSNVIAYGNPCKEVLSK